MPRAGAVRYRLPPGTAGQTDVYGYFLATVSADGARYRITVTPFTGRVTVAPITGG